MLSNQKQIWCINLDWLNRIESKNVNNKKSLFIDAYMNVVYLYKRINSIKQYSSKKGLNQAKYDDMLTFNLLEIDATKKIVFFCYN